MMNLIFFIAVPDHGGTERAGHHWSSGAPLEHLSVRAHGATIPEFELDKKTTTNIDVKRSDEELLLDPK